MLIYNSKTMSMNSKEFTVKWGQTHKLTGNYKNEPITFKVQQAWAVWEHTIEAKPSLKEALQRKLPLSSNVEKTKHYTGLT